MEAEKGGGRRRRARKVILRWTNAPDGTKGIRKRGNRAGKSSPWCQKKRGVGRSIFADIEPSLWRFFTFQPRKATLNGKESSSGGSRRNRYHRRKEEFVLGVGNQVSMNDLGGGEKLREGTLKVGHTSENSQVRFLL